MMVLAALALRAYLQLARLKKGGGVQVGPRPTEESGAADAKRSDKDEDEEENDASRREASTASSQARTGVTV